MARVPAASHCEEGGSRVRPGAGRPPAQLAPHPLAPWCTISQGLGGSRAPDADPVGRLLAGHERLQVVAAQVVGRPLIDPLREPLQQAHGHVPADGGAGDGVGPGLPKAPRPAPLIPPAQEGEPLKEEAACLLHALRVRAPVLQAVVCEVPQDVQALRRRDVPMPLLLDLREQPRLEQGATAGGRWSAGRWRNPSPQTHGPQPPGHAHTTFKAQEFQATTLSPQLQKCPVPRLSPISCHL